MLLIGFSCLSAHRQLFICHWHHRAIGGPCT